MRHWSRKTRAKGVELPPGQFLVPDKEEEPCSPGQPLSRAFFAERRQSFPQGVGHPHGEGPAFDRGLLVRNHSFLGGFIFFFIPAVKEDFIVFVEYPPLPPPAHAGKVGQANTHEPAVAPLPEHDHGFVLVVVEEDVPLSSIFLVEPRNISAHCADHRTYEGGDDGDRPEDHEHDVDDPAVFVHVDLILFHGD